MMLSNQSLYHEKYTIILFLLSTSCTCCPISPHLEPRHVSDLFKRQVRLGLGQVKVGSWTIYHDTYLTCAQCRVGLDRPVALCLKYRVRFFLGWIGFQVKNHDLYLICKLLQVKNYNSYFYIALVGSGWTEFFLERIEVGPSFFFLERIESDVMRSLTDGPQSLTLPRRGHVLSTLAHCPP